jgi:hypothetical protein
LKEDRCDVLWTPNAHGSGRCLVGVGLQPGGEARETIGSFRPRVRAPCP